MSEKGKLLVVGTPIGNLSDLSKRACQALGAVDFIAAEDTRVTLKLLNKFDIKTPLISYREHNKTSSGNVILERIKSGETAALVSDAGTPAISDPGEDLVKLCRENGIEILVIPGPSAITAALSISGMDSRRFCFEGFLSANKSERKAHLRELKTEQRTMVFYEAPHKLQKTLSDMFEVFGDRKIALCKELTKIYEQVTVTTLGKAVEEYKEKSPKGEFVLIIEGAAPQEKTVPLNQAVELARRLMEQGSSASQAAKEAAKETNHPKGDVYKNLVQ